MSTFDLVEAKQIILDEDNTDKDLSVYLPYAVSFNVAAMSSSQAYQDITVNIKDMTGVDYAIYPYVQNAVGYTTPYYLTLQVQQKNATNVKIRMFNEQAKNIKASEWAILIVPYM